MRLADLVATSGRVAETRSRSEKIAALADLLRRLSPREIDIAVACLSGHFRQGRIGIGFAAVRDFPAGDGRRGGYRGDGAEDLRRGPMNWMN